MIIIDKIDYGTETAEILHYECRHAELHGGSPAVLYYSEHTLTANQTAGDGIGRSTL